jgi:hypothetical protein
MLLAIQNFFFQFVLQSVCIDVLNLHTIVVCRCRYMHTYMLSSICHAAPAIFGISFWINRCVHAWFWNIYQHDFVDSVTDLILLHIQQMFRQKWSNPRIFFFLSTFSLWLNQRCTNMASKSVMNTRFFDASSCSKRRITKRCRRALTLMAVLCIQDWISCRAGVSYHDARAAMHRDLILTLWYFCIDRWHPNRETNWMDKACAQHQTSWSNQVCVCTYMCVYVCMHLYMHIRTYIRVCM